MPGQTRHIRSSQMTGWRRWGTLCAIAALTCCETCPCLVADDSVPWARTTSKAITKRPISGRVNTIENKQPASSPALPAIRQTAAGANYRTAGHAASTFSSKQSALNVKPALNVSTTAAAPEELKQAWWLKPVLEPMRDATVPLSISLESALVRTLHHSYQIKIFSDAPLIRETGIVEAQSAFDWYGFLENRWDDTNDPVGSTLTGVPIGGRYRNNQYSSSTGARRRTIAGGEVEASQKFGYQQNNSIFLFPSPQATARLSLGYTHPLLRGSGQIYTTSLVCLAEIDKTISEQEFSRKLQSHLMEVARAFWQLHIARAIVVQKQRSLDRLSHLAEELRERSEIDTSVTLLQRVEAEVATREAEVTRAATILRNTEAQLRALINDPELGSYQDTELIPLDLPLSDSIPIDMELAMVRAVQFRPEIQQAIEQIKAASIRLDMSRNQMLPLLNLTTETYVAGLQGGANIGDAWVNQFSVGTPSYGVGSSFEYPLGNRAARTRTDRRAAELRQMQAQYETTLKTLKLDVGTAVRELRTSYAEMMAQRKAAVASAAQLSTITERWSYLSGEAGNGSLILENMLQAQNRVTASESAYLKAWVTYNLALINIKKSTGELLQHEQMTWDDYHTAYEGIKTRAFGKPDLGPQGWKP